MPQNFGVPVVPTDPKVKQNEKNQIRVQEFINKFKFKTRDLDNSSIKTVPGNQDWQGYAWVREATETTDERRLRYREYREMCKVPELNLGVNIYADNATQLNAQKNVLEVQSDNNKIIEILENLFFDTLDINSNLWKYARNMCKLGDEFGETIVDDDAYPKHIVAIERFREPENVYRIEKKGVLEKFIYKPNDDQNIIEQPFQPWKIIHFKIDEEDFEPYGKSILESGRRTWKKLALMEDAMLIYRISRAPERRVFYIDVGTLSTTQANKYIETIKRKFRKRSFINPRTGEVDEKADVLGITEDFYIPVRANSQGTRIETLPPGLNLGEVDDVKYFRDNILKTMGIPPGYMGGSTEGAAYDQKSYLSHQEIQFSRTIERIQKFLIKGLEKIAIIELALNKIDPQELKNFKILLTPPSNIDQMMDTEVMTNQFALITTIKGISPEGSPFLPDDWIYKNILGFSDQEINKIKLQSQMQMQMMLQMQQIYGGEGGVGGGAGGAGGAMMPPAGNIAPEAGGTPIEAGGPAETIPPPPGEGGEAEEAGLVASKQFIEFDGGKFLMDNKEQMMSLLKYIQLYEEKKNVERPKKKSNGATKLLMLGELRGLIKSNKKTLLNEAKVDAHLLNENESNKSKKKK